MRQILEIKNDYTYIEAQMLYDNFLLNVFIFIGVIYLIGKFKNFDKFKNLDKLNKFERKTIDKIV